MLEKCNWEVLDHKDNSFPADQQYTSWYMGQPCWSQDN